MERKILLLILGICGINLYISYRFAKSAQHAKDTVRSLKEMIGL